MLAELPALAPREPIILLWLREAPESDPHLDGIDSRIWRGEAGTGNMHKPHLRAPVVLAAQKMQSQRARSRKIYPRCSRWHLRIAEKRAASEFHIGCHSAGTSKIPFQPNRVQPQSISGAVPLRQHKHRHNTHR